MSVNVRIRNGLCPDPTTGDGGATEGDIRGSFSDIIDVVGVKDLAGGHALVTQNSPAAMSVLVAPGVVYIPNADYDELDSNQVKFWEAVVTDDTEVEISENTSGQTRIDLICLKMDTTIEPDEHGSNIATLVAVAGTPGAGVPATPDNYAKLAEIEVANGASTIVNADITDSRVQSTINGDYVGASVSVTTKGDLQTHNGTVPARLAVGSDGQIPRANSAATNGIDWTPQYSSIFRQALINPNCQVNQLITAVNLTTGKLFGPVDMFYAKGAGTAVSAGTITQSTTANCGTSGYALKLAGVTLTGTGKTHVYTPIISNNAKLYKNKTASFGLRVYHDVGSAINYVIKINKANSANNFSAVTNIATASAQSVPNTTDTLIKLENVSLGDCSNGIEIEIEASCGAITTKNFEYTEWQFNEGSVLLPFACGKFDCELIECKKFVETSYNYGTEPGTADGFTEIYFPGCIATVTTNINGIDFKFQKFSTPTINVYGSDSATGAGTLNELRDNNVGGLFTVNALNKVGVNGFQYFTMTDSVTAGHYFIFNWVAKARPTIA